MKALVFHHSYAREAMAKVSGEINARGFVSSLAPVRLEEVPAPVPPAEGWVGCDTIFSGVCGSDAKQIFLNGRLDNPLNLYVIEREFFEAERKMNRL